MKNDAEQLARALSTLQRFMFWNNDPTEQYNTFELKLLYKV